MCVCVCMFMHAGAHEVMNMCLAVLDLPQLSSTLFSEFMNLKFMTWSRLAIGSRGPPGSLCLPGTGIPSVFLSGTGVPQSLSPWHWGPLVSSSMALWSPSFCLSGTGVPQPLPPWHWGPPSSASLALGSSSLFLPGTGVPQALLPWHWGPPSACWDLNVALCAMHLALCS